MEHTSTGRSDKNRRIADSMRATYAKRDGQVWSAVFFSARYRGTSSLQDRRKS